MPTVSVIIPTYNRRESLVRAVDSVLKQTVQDFEVVIIDDASTDDTVDEIKKVKDPRIVLLRNGSRKGAAFSRNRGIEQAQGDLIAFLDSDDRWLPNKLARQVKVWNECQQEVGLIYCGARTVKGGRVYSTHIPNHQGWVFDALLNKNIVTGSTSTSMLPKSVLTSVGGFDESLPALEDYDLWLRVARHWKFAFAPDVMVEINKDVTSSRMSWQWTNLAKAREMILSKYRSEIRMAGIERDRLISIGKTWLLLGERGKARRLFSEAIKAEGFSMKSRALWLATWVAPPDLSRLFIQAAKIRDRIRGFHST